MDAILNDLMRRVQTLEQQIASGFGGPQADSQQEGGIVPGRDNPFIQREKANAPAAMTLLAPHDQSKMFPPRGTKMTPEEKRQAAVERIQTPQEQVQQNAQERSAERQDRMRSRGQTPHQDRIPDEYKAPFEFTGRQDSSSDSVVEAARDRVEDPAKTPAAKAGTDEMAERFSQIAEATVGAIERTNSRLTDVARRLEQIESDLEMKTHE